MASSKEDVASMALARLGEPAISSFDENTDTAEKVKQLYESTILGLLSGYEWQWCSKRAVLSIDGGKTPENEWTYGFLMPAIRTDRVGNPYRVYNSTSRNAPEFFDYEIENKWILTNASTIVIEYTQRMPENVWPGYFERMAVEALAAVFALPITENESKENWHTGIAYGSPSEQGEGGLLGRAMKADARGTPTRGLLDETDPMTSARFGGSRGERW